MADTTTVLYEKQGRIARVTMNRPEKYNAITDVMVTELLAALERADADPEVRVIILAGAGKHFCTGYDLEGGSSYAKIDVPLQGALSVSRGMRKTYHAIWNTRKPVIARIQGYSIAGGCYVQMLADIAICADDAVFGHPAMASAGPTGMPMFTWLLGPRKAKELLLTGRLIDGKEAERIGLVNMSVPAERLDAEVQLMAEDIASVPMDGATLTKEAINTVTEIMGLSATLRTQGELNALGRYGEANMDLAWLRENTKKMLARIKKR